MTNLISELEEIIKKEIDIFKNLEQITNNKTKFIIDRNIEELEIYNKEETRLAFTLSSLEDKREKIFSKLAKELNLDAKTLNITKIIKYIDKESGKRISEISKEQIDLILKIKNTNELNTKLVNNSLEYVEFLLNLVTNNGNLSDNNYSSKGENSSFNNSKKLFDVKR